MQGTFWTDTESAFCIWAREFRRRFQFEKRAVIEWESKNDNKKR